MTTKFINLQERTYHIAAISSWDAPVSLEPDGENAAQNDAGTRRHYMMDAGSRTNQWVGGSAGQLQ
jgi:hypothetical protein